MLISPFALERIYPEAGELKTNLTREQVRTSPPKKEPISRCYEGAYNEYYGYPSYWTGGCLWGTGNFPLAANPSLRLGSIDAAAQPCELKQAESRLCSANALVGYACEAIDGELGRVETLLFDDVDWAASAALVDGTRAWPETRIVAPRAWLGALDVPGGRVPVKGCKGSFKAVASYDPRIAREERRGRMEDICHALRATRQWREPRA